jgi:hypothetical protein
MISLQVFRALDPLRWRLECFNGILSQRHRAQERVLWPENRIVQPFPGRFSREKYLRSKKRGGRCRVSDSPVDVEALA